MSSTPLDHRNLVARARELAPFVDDESTSRALAATLTALAEVLARDECERFVDSLPPGIRAVMPTARGGAPLPAGDFYRRVALAEGIALPLAVEHAQVMCRALGELLPPERRTWLIRRLPELGVLFEPPEPTEAPTHVVAPSAQRDLAEGHVGGRHPLADANPEILAHRHSIARNPDPHAESRLSTARGLTQERDEHTLAAGEPGSRRSVSRSH